MDEFTKRVIDAFRLEAGQETALTLWEVWLAMSLCLLCVLIVGHVYRFTHKTVGYSQSYVQTLVLTALVTTLIMIVIGSNIARAFSLIGALSIIRFRNAIKETRDVGYIFLAMAIAMACGTRFYGVAISATVFISAVMLLLHFMNYGTGRIDPERMLRVQLPPGTDPNSMLGTVLRRLFSSYSVVLIETVRQGLYIETLLSVRPKPQTTEALVIEEVSKVNGNLKVTYHCGLGADEL